MFKLRVGAPEVAPPLRPVPELTPVIVPVLLVACSLSPKPANLLCDTEVITPAAVEDAAANTASVPSLDATVTLLVVVDTLKLVAWLGAEFSILITSSVAPLTSKLIPEPCASTIVSLLFCAVIVLSSAEAVGPFQLLV